MVWDRGPPNKVATGTMVNEQRMCGMDKVFIKMGTQGIFIMGPFTMINLVVKENTSGI